jgi:DNA-binding NtrC family response regulator
MTSTSLVPEVEQSTSKRLRVVLAGTDFKSQEVLVSLLRKKGLEPIPSFSLNETRFLLGQDGIALVICHASSNDWAFRDLLRIAARNGSRVPVIVCADFYDPHLYLETMELGAFDYFTYPYYGDGVEWVVGNALKEAMKHGHICYEPESVSYESVSC